MAVPLLRSQNGWPASENRAAIKVKNYDIPGTNRNIACSSLVAPILVAFIVDFHNLVEPINKGKFDEWGHSLRNVRGSVGTVSNHGSGTACDLNATLHPLGATGTFTPKQVKTIHDLCKKYGLRAGLDYKSRPDPMHFEIVESPEQVKARVASMKLKMPKEKK
jgi:hypothetical protein